MKPIFIVANYSLLGRALNALEDVNPLLAKFEGEKKIFGDISRLYINGSLENKAHYDIVDFVAGEIKDIPVQECQLVLESEEVVECLLVMVTASNTGRKFAFIVDNDWVEISQAYLSLWNGEFLAEGVDLINELTPKTKEFITSCQGLISELA